MLQIYNTLTRQKETFQPLHGNKVGLYVCGVTVYDYCHIGHARTYLTFDNILRYLKYRGYDVTYVRNITDIDDKIIKRAEENKINWKDLTHHYIQAMHEDLHFTLNTLSPDSEPKATDYVPAMVKFIEKLIDKGYAYLAPNKDVYYHVGKFESYGCLSHRDLDDLMAGARIEINESKKNPLDFVLWKSAKPGEPFWESPWGIGRPGWHIECSVMAMEILGETFDIHGGGPDLKFPHHENERAQSEALTGKTFVKTWMHAGYLQINKEKMSKSTGNFITIREFLREYHPEVLRYFNVSSHYRSPIEYSTDNIEIARGALERIYTALRGLSKAEAPSMTEYEKRFQTAMDDDFNTPEALAVLFDLVREINRERETNLTRANELGAVLRKLGNLLGILNAQPESFLQDRQIMSSKETQEIENLIAERNHARKQKDWLEADRIRAKLLGMGIELEDTSSGTLWRKTTINV